MTKKLKPEERPITIANLTPILQSRCAHRGRYIGNAEKVLAEQKAIVQAMRIQNGAPFTPEQKEAIYGKVLNPIRADIAELAYEQKLERTILKALAPVTTYNQELADQVDYLQDIIEQVRIVAEF